MARKRKRQEPASRAPPTKPQFFRILMPGFTKRLIIPQPFNKYIDGEIQNKATVVSPLGKSWPVEVRRTANAYYFGEGWQEFCQGNDLNVGYFLLFRYEGEKVFAVTVFDQTTCMKEYSPSRTDNNLVDNFHSNVGLEPYESPRGQKSLTDISLVEMTKSVDYQNQNADLASACIEGSQFEINITSSNPCEEPCLPLPQELIKCFSGENGTMATIFSSLGRSWHVKLNRDSESFYLADGWQSFAVAHNLRRGDSLVFKHKFALTFDAAIFDNRIRKTEHNLGVISGIANGRIPAEEKNSSKDYESFDASPMSLFDEKVVGGMKTTTGGHRSVEMEEHVGCNGDGKVPNVGHVSKTQSHFEVINYSKHQSKYSLVSTDPLSLFL